MIALLALLLACSEAPVPESPPACAPAAPATPEAPARGGFVDRDQGQQHPPLPADNPAWEWDAGGFVPDHGWYGEHSWHDVRMRVAGHLAVTAWSQAQGRSMAGDLVGAAAALSRLGADLDALVPPPAGPARALRDTLRDAAARDAALLSALAEGAPPLVPDGGLAALRARYLAQALAPAPDPAALRALQVDLEAHLAPREDLDLDAFRDFEDRHRLRAALWSAWADSLDPTHAHAPWGYWEPGEIAREALALGVAAGWLGGADWSGRAEAALQGAAPDAGAGPAWTWPGQAAAALVLPSQRPDFTAAGLGRLPTGDSLIDVGGAPGPRAIGTLERLGLDDAAHQSELARRADALDAALARDPAAVRPLLQELVAALDAHGHGSRYYNIKQARNAGVRQLARAGHPDAALDLLADHLPLHHQDWACPNRQGILLALQGRLELAAGRPTADATHEAARQAALDFLALADAAAQAPPGQGPGSRPPWMQHGRPPHRPSEKTATSPH